MRSMLKKQRRCFVLLMILVLITSSLTPLAFAQDGPLTMENPQSDEEATVQEDALLQEKASFTEDDPYAGMINIASDWVGSVFGDNGGQSHINVLNFEITEHEDETVTLRSSNNRGKIASTSEGIAYYYKAISPGANFELTATAHVDEWTANNQVSFGIMLRSNVLENENLSTFSGNYLALGALDQEMKAFYREGYIEGAQLGEQIKNGYEFGLARAPQQDEVFQLSLRKFGNTYTLTIGDETKTIEYPEDMFYAGLFTSRNATVTFSNVSLTVQPPIDVGEWQFSAFGSNTSISSSPPRNPDPMLHEDGSVTLYAAGGKVASADEGLSFYYKSLPADAHFTLRASAAVLSFNADNSISTPNQKSFGLMLRDHVDTHGNTATQTSNYVAVGALDTSYMRTFYKHGATTVPSTGTQVKLQPFDARVPTAGEVYDLLIRKSGDVYVVSTNGQTEVIVQEDLFEEHAFTGFYVARDAEVTFSQFDIQLDPREPLSLILDTTAMKTDYLIGESLDLSGLSVQALLRDETGHERSELLAPGEYIVTGFDSATPGEKDLQVHFNGASANLEVHVNALTIIDLSLRYLPAKLDYFIEDIFDAEGLVVAAQYNTGVTQELSAEQYEVLIPDAATTAAGEYIFTQAGTYQVEIYSIESPNISTSFTIQVSTARIQDLEIRQLPEKRTYFIGETLDLSGLVVYALYDNDSQVRLLAQEYTSSQLDTSTPGQRIITIFHKGHSSAFNVMVKEREINHIQVTGYPKTTYTLGESFDSTGLEVSLVYDNNDKELLSPQQYSLDIEQFNSTQAGVYPIHITPIDSRLAATTLYVTVREALDYTWQFIRFGQSIGTNRNIWELKEDSDQLEDRIIHLEASIGQNAGKITGDHDGITYYYTVIDAVEDNFELSADIKVIHYAKTPHDGQESFGIMARDAIGQPNDSSVFSSNIAAIGGFSGRTIWPNGTQLFARTGVVAPDGEGSQDIQKIMLKEERPAAHNTHPVQDYRLTLAKTNSGFIGKLNNDIEAIIFEPEILNVQDNKIYVGFYTAREAIIEVSNIQFLVTAAATDSPRVDAPVQAKDPRLDIISLDKTPLTEYTLKARTNVDGVLSARLGANQFLGEFVVTAGEIVEIPTILQENSETSFSITFIPDDTQYLTSYHRIVQNFTVTNKIYQAGADLYVSPSGTAAGSGTISQPLDIDTAIDFVLPGQKIIVLDGHYLRQSPIHIRKYNDGTTNARKYLVAAEGARPVFDFDRRSDGVLHEGNYWHVSGLDFTRSAGNTKGYHIGGSYNIIEYSRFYDNGDSGLQISRLDDSLASIAEWPAHNLIQYSVSFDNRDPAENNADGFAIKLTVGEGNILRGVVAHNNIDDGYDLYTKVGTGSIGTVLIEESIAFNNGRLSNGTAGGGDKNGFKLGGEGVHVPHIIRDSLAFGNGKYGFTSNSNPGLIAENVIGYNNSGGNFDFTTYTNITPDFVMNGIYSYQRDYTTRDRYPMELASEINFMYNGVYSANSVGLHLEGEQIIFSEPQIPIDPYVLPSIVNQRDAEDNIIWGEFFKLIVPQIEATIAFNPPVLNLRGIDNRGNAGQSNSGPVATVYIDLAEGYNLADILHTSIMLNGELRPLTGQQGYVEQPIVEEDGRVRYMIKFSRQELATILPTGENVPITITGQLNSGIQFRGTTSITVRR